MARKQSRSTRTEDVPDPVDAPEADGAGGPEADDQAASETEGSAADTPGADEAGEDRSSGANGEGRTDADRLAALESEVADLTDRLARARADYQNLQRRVDRDAVLERQRVKARFLEDFLQVYEYGQMAAFEAERNPGPLADGVRMVVREFDRLLEKEGVERITGLGGPFDRDVHEAVATEAADGVPAGHVSRVVAPGYRLGERVLRFAKVAVAPGDQEEEE